MPMKDDDWYSCAPPEKGVVGKFSYYDQVDIKVSREADREITKQIIVLQTRIPGDIDIPPYIKVRPDNQFDLIKRFPDAWKAFEGKDVPVSGTPLTALNLNADRLLVLRIAAVRTMEQLASLTDQQCEQMGFGTKSQRNQARDKIGWIDPMMGGAIPAAQPRAMTQSEINELVAQGIAKALAEAKAKEQVAQPPPKRRGRPPRAKPIEQATEAA